MKILHILSTNSFSGAENVVCQIANIFKNSNHEIIYASPDGPIREALFERGIKFVPLTKLTRKEIQKAIKKVRPNIIHSHDMLASFLCSISSTAIPLVSHIHNNGLDSRKLNFKTVAFLIASKRIKHIFWVSRSAEKDFYFKSLVKSKSSLLPNIVDVDAIRNKASQSSPNSYDIVFLGRLDYPKNPFRFVELINLIKDAIPNVTAAIIGEGKQRADTEKMVLQYNLENNITFLGYQSNPLIYLKRAKALVMTSFWEGTPMCSLEAFTLGVPVIATPVDGLKDLIINDENGFLSNSNEELSKKLIQIIKDVDYFHKLSEGAYKTSNVINDKENYFNEILNIYDSVVD